MFNQSPMFSQILNEYNLAVTLVLGLATVTSFYLVLNRRYHSNNADSNHTTVNVNKEIKTLKAASPEEIDERFTPSSFETTRQNNSKASHHHYEQFVQHRIKQLPIPVQRHLQQTLSIILDDDRGMDYMMHQPIRFIKNVHFEQEGSYAQGSQDVWVPFHGSQNITCNPASPGFVLDEDVRILGNRPILKWFEVNIHDSYERGKSDVNVDFMNLIPVLRHAEMSQFTEGHLEQWMANIPLYPTSFIYQNGGHLQWIANNESHTPRRILCSSYPDTYSKAIAKVTEPWSEETAEVEYIFDENGLIVAACGILHPDESHERIWERRFLDYQLRDGMLVPTKIEFGWCDGNTKEFHRTMMISITKINYTFEA